MDSNERQITAYTYELQKNQQLWSETVEEHILVLTPPLERKRQETIFELIYTELDFLRDLNYIIKVCTYGSALFFFYFVNGKNQQKNSIR